ncbi:hypothetical protein GYH30_042808 [Glycine max]|nr:hypothetical protein GYH30_042808 [Glycine max]
MCVFGVPHLAVLRHLVSSDASCETRKKIIDPSSEKKFHEATMVYYNVLIHLRGPNALTNFTPPQRDSPSPSSLPVVAETLAEVIAILDKLKNDKSQNKELLDSSPNEDDDDLDGEDLEEGIIYEE